MSKPRLHIGDKNYSSWSMRPWLALRHGGVDFEEVNHELPELGGGPPVFGAISPTARVPALDLGQGVVIAESLAICEWAAEKAPHLYPAGPAGDPIRAMARAGATIMHAGFAALRTDCPMNIRRRTDASRMTEAGRADAKKVDALWNDFLQKSGGPFLFGKFGVIDAMYAPVVTRFVTYAIPRTDAAQRYIDAIEADAHVAEWIRAARAETRALARTDAA